MKEAVPVAPPWQSAGVAPIPAFRKLLPRVTSTVSASGGQPVLPVVVSTKVTWPMASSAAVGLYWAFSPLPAMVPDPPLQDPPVALVTEPESTTGRSFMHTTWSGPAFAWFGWAAATMVPWACTGAQPFASVTCTVYVPAPAVMLALVAPFDHW